MAATQQQPDFLEFYKLQEQSAREKVFKDSHTDGWIHGLPNSYNVIEYEPFRSTASNADYNTGQGNKNEAYFAPKIVMAKVEPDNTVTRLSSLGSAQPETTTSPHSEDFRKDEAASPFSGLFHIPNFSYSFPGHPVPDKVSAYVYQAHFEVGEITYMFGGIYQDAQLSLRNLGIPRSTDLSRISVHLPCELPPFVNKEVLMSPLMAQNPIFIVFNPTRGTVTGYDMSMLGDTYPGHLCQMKGTKVSLHQVFFCGGFEVKIDDVSFQEDVQRWIVRKSIVVNDHGYILDTNRMKFTRVDLKSKLDVVYGGRLGGALVSSVFEVQTSQETEVALPGGAFKAFEDREMDDTVEGEKKTRPAVPSLKVSVQQPAQASPTSSQTVNQTASQTSAQTANQTSNQAFSQASPTANHVSGLSSTVPVVSTSGTAPVRSPLRARSSSSSQSASLSRSGSKKSDTSSGSPLTPTASASGTLKMTSMLQKSSRLFHRPRHNLVMQTYSSQVKQHRGSTHSRPASPHLAKSPPVRPVDALSIASGSDDSMLSSIEEKRDDGVKSDRGSLRRERADSMRSERESLKERESMKERESLKEKESLKDRESCKEKERESIRTGGEKDSVRFEDEKESVRFEDEKESVRFEDGESDKTNTLDDKKSDDKKSAKSSESVESSFAPFLLADLALRSGIFSVTVFQFGGFKLAPCGTRFVATSELLKIELILDDPSRDAFHPEALIYDISPRALWPAPRGYFAYALIANDLPSDACAYVPPADLDLTPSTLSEVFSSRTGKSHRLYNADAFFERRSLMVHGGVDHNAQVFSDIHVFTFATGRWLVMQTYAFDYYNIAKTPAEDEDIDSLTLDAQVRVPPFVEAELRCCHHQALVFREDDREYVTFLGGFTNDYLRHFDKSYACDKYDVARLSRFLMSCANSNVLRVPVLNLRTQTWKFTRYFYDLSERVVPGAVDVLRGPEYMRNLRVCFHGGAFSIVGKQITICHGLASFVLEKAEDFGKIAEHLDAHTIFLGGHCHLSFPSM